MAQAQEQSSDLLSHLLLQPWSFKSTSTHLFTIGMQRGIALSQKWKYLQI